MAVLACAYPVVLTNKDWQKKKGIAGKTKSTGVGEKLTELEKAVAKSAFGNLDPVVLGTETMDPVLLKKKLDSLDKSLAGQTRTLAQLIKTADKAMADAIPVFAASSVSKSVATHLGTMRQELAKFDGALDAYPKTLKKAIQVEYAKALKQNKTYTYFAPAAKEAEQTALKLLAEIKEVEKTKKIADVHTKWKDGTSAPPRKITTWCKLWDQMVLKDFPELAKFAGYDKKAMAEIFPLPWLQDVGNENMSTASNKLQALVQGGQSEDRVMDKFCLEYSRSVIEARKLTQAMAKAWTVLGKF